MAVRKKTTDIRSYRKKENINIGVILFAFILVYIIVEIGLSITNRPIAFYEVGEGAIVKTIPCTGLAIRTEQTIKASKSGYLNFYCPEESKISVGQNVCAVSEKELDLSLKEDAEAEDLTEDEKTQMLSSVRTFVNNYRESAFFETYSFKDSIQNIFDKKTDQNKEERMNIALSEQKEGSYEAMTSDRDGILVYEADGFEGITVDQVTDELFDKSDYKKPEYHENQKVNEGDSIYKVVTEETWNLVVRLDADTAEPLINKKSVTIRFLKDDVEMIAGLQLEKKGKDIYYAYLTLDSAMIRYASDRYLDLEITVQNAKGLKIPKSAVVKKDCYEIPSEYIMENGEADEQGVLVYNNGNTEFQKTDVFYTDSSKNMIYIDAENLPKGTVIRMENSNNTRTLSETISQAGVYEAGSGYAVFTTIDIEAENEDYYITGSGVSNQLSDYDRIVLNADKVSDDEILIKR